MTRTDYHDVLKWLFGLESEGIRFGLENTQELLRRVGNPHLGLPAIHVAGSNGKGSTSSMIEASLRAAGLRTGLYTSPHLLEFTERIKVNGEEISPQTVEGLAAELRPHVLEMGEEGMRVTFFEVTTVMALLHFQRSDVEMLVAEVGMGGRLDSTNVLSPVLSVITPIGIEHSGFLGQTIEEIALEKAGIMKAGCPVLTNNQGEALEVLEREASRMGAKLHTVSQPPYLEVLQPRGPPRFRKDGRDYEIGMDGAYQIENAALAMEALRLLDHPAVNDDAIAAGLLDARMPARLELVSYNPRIILDSTHNAPGAMALAGEMEHMGDVILVLGILQDKDAEAIGSLLTPLARSVIVVEANTDRAMAADRFAKALGSYTKDLTFEECVADGMERALEIAKPESTILVTGSIFTAGDALRWLRAR